MLCDDHDDVIIALLRTAPQPGRRAMLIPVFRCEQDADEVRVRIRVPHVRVSDAEAYVEGPRAFVFHCAPYLLRLALPEDVAEDEDCSAVYLPDEEGGTVVASLRKRVPGQHFEGLDMLGELLRPADPRQALGAEFPSIEEIGVTERVQAEEEEEEEEEEEMVEEDARPHPTFFPASTRGWEDGDVCAALRERAERLQEQVQVGPGFRARGYGFDAKYRGILRPLHEATLELVGALNPETVGPALRTCTRLDREADDFDEDRYLADTAYARDDPIYQEAISLVPFWHRPRAAAVAEFDEDEQETMREVRRVSKHFIPPRSGRELQLLMGAVDIAFGFAYDHRTTGGEPTVESCATILRLCATLAGMEMYEPSPKGVKDLMCTCARRALTYPYLRNWRLTSKVLVDVSKILRGGRRVLLKCLLRVRAIFHCDDNHYYLFNKLFLDDYCGWLQQQQQPMVDEAIAGLATAWTACRGRLRKEDVALGLRLVDTMAAESGGQNTTTT